jgi:hypothetical protein
MRFGEGLRLMGADHVCVERTFKSHGGEQWQLRDEAVISRR